MSAAAAPAAGSGRLASRTTSAAPRAATVLSRREATLRAAATTCLAAIALAQAIELPAVLVQSAELAVLSFAAMTLCVGSGLALAAAAASGGPAVWRVAAATAAVVLAGWGVPHAITVPELPGARGDWAALPGVACVGLAAAVVVLAAAAVRPTRAAARGLATAFAVSVALAPGACVLLYAVGPGPPRGDAALAGDVRAHRHRIVPERAILFRPGASGNHYVTRVSAPSHPPAIGVALVVVAAALFVCGAVSHLHRRGVVPRPPATDRAA